MEADAATISHLATQDAKTRAEAMSKEIADQLTNADYREIMREVIQSGNLYGTGILKGPLVTTSISKRWATGEDGTRALMEIENISPYLEFVRIWDIYPDMEADKLEDCEYVIQRHSYTKAQLRKLARRPDFDTDAIKAYVSENPDGDCQRENFETDLSEMGFKAQASGSQSQRRYELREFWGYVPAKELEEHLEREEGDDPGDLYGEVFANVWVVGDIVIKATKAPVDGVLYPYFFYYYDKDETSIYGEGIASIMRDPQQLFNSSIRQMLDNAAICAGPIFEANLDLLADDEDPTDIRPFHVFLRHGDGMNASAPAIRSFSLASHTQEYMQMAELFSKYADETTAIPRYLQGQAQGATGGAGRTASGLSMMFGAANIMLKDQVKNFDDGITQPFIQAMFHWNMQFNDKESIKGDMEVEAKGSASLVAKEVHTERLTQLMQGTANPADMPLFDRAKMWRDVLKYFDLSPDYIKTDEQIQQDKQREIMASEQARVQSVLEDAAQKGVPIDRVYIDLLNGVDQNVVLSAMEG